jgi:hypothetical protein
MMKVKLFVVLLVLLNFASYTYDGYLAKASFLFNGFYIATLLGSAYILCKLEMKPLLIFSGVACALGIVVEYVNTEVGTWVYFTGGQPPLFVAVGWISLLAVIVYSSKILKKYVNLPFHRVYPSLVCFSLFFVFSYSEGSMTGLTVGLYSVMAVVGVYSSLSGTVAWNSSLLLTGIVVGSISEALGASCGLWSFGTGGLLPLSMGVAWSANAFAFAGLAAGAHLDVEELFDQ